MDVTDMIMLDHQRQRMMFALLDITERTDTRALATIWRSLAVALEVHAQTEEDLFYPRLLSEVPGEEDDTRDAIGDHNEIRAGIRAAAAAEVGTDAWWAGVDRARTENDEHLGEEERGPLARFRRTVPADERERLAVRFATLAGEVAAREHARPGAIDLTDKDPDRYVEAND